MITLCLARTELRRLTAGRLPKLALTAITLIPLLYGALYLYANWDPYGRLGAVPAAVVVDDDGAAREDGSMLRAGEQVFDRLSNSGAFDWQRTSEGDANAGVADGRYTFALVVPRGFSEALLSPGRFEPEQARLRVVTNDANNYLVGTMADKVASEVREAIASDAGTEAANRFLVGFATAHDKTRQAAEGAHRIADGAGRLRDGVDRARDGTTALADGAHRLLDGQRALVGGAGRLAEGADRLAVGSDQLSNGLGQLRQEAATLPPSTRALAEGSAKVADGAAQVAAGNEQLADRADLVGGLSQHLVDNLGQSRQRIADELRRSGLPEETVQQVLNGLDELNEPVVDANDELQHQIGQPRGKFVALVILVLQLVTAGGTFPWQTIPEPLHPLHRVLPLTHVVDGLRHLIYGGPGVSATGGAALVLLCYLTAGLVLSTVAAWRQRIWTPAKLKPELVL